MMFLKAFDDIVRGAKLYPVWFSETIHWVLARYRNTALGFLWAPGQFILMSLGLTTVFGALRGRDLHQFLPYVMAGMLVTPVALSLFGEFNRLFTSNSMVIHNQANPLSYFAYESIAGNLLTIAHNVPVYWIVCAIVGGFAMPHWTILPALLMLLVAIFFWGMAIAVVCARYADFSILLLYLSTPMSFVTPVFWRAEDMKGWRHIIVEANPFYYLIDIVRSPLMGAPANPEVWVGMSVLVVTGIIAWLAIFVPFRRRIPFWV